MSKSELTKLVDFIFLTNNIMEEITNKTGFNYSIDFFTAYETSNTGIGDKDKNWIVNSRQCIRPCKGEQTKLLHSYRLSKVSWLIYVCTFI